MAVAYAKVLRNMARDIVVVGRGNPSCEKFESETGIQPVPGGLKGFLGQTKEVFETAILAVTVTSLAEAAKSAMHHGIKRILLEKPGGLNLLEIEGVAQAAREAEAQVFIAYNRRFFASAQAAKRLIADDGEVTSVLCNFTEAVFRIGARLHPPHVMKNWFFMNSTHVVDLGLHLAGVPSDLQALRRGGLDWHPRGAVFAGHGSLSEQGVFGYFADWLAPGRWGVEVATRRHRLILQPLETLRIQKAGSFVVEDVTLNNEADIAFKPGLFRMLESFFGDSDQLCTLEQHLRHCREVYEIICPAN